AAHGTPGRIERTDGQSEALSCPRHQRSHPAHRWYERFAQHHRHQQRRRSSYLRDCRHRGGGQPLRHRSSADGRDQEGEGMTILNVPGLFNSGPEHWQSYWEQLYPNCRRVLQKEWEAPHRDDWVEGIEQAVACAEQPIVLTAHSTACAAVAHWAAGTRLWI